MNKILSLILSFCMLFSFIGCGTDTKNVEKAVQTETAVRSTSEPIAGNMSDSVKSVKEYSDKLTAHFIDVGQGDSEFIELPNGKTILIDAGNQRNGNEIISYIQSLGYSKIDYVIATHPHADHIGGMSVVLNSFEIGRMYMPKKEHTSKTFENMLDTIEQKNIALYTAKSGVNVLLAENISVDLLAPIGKSDSDLNNYSAVCKITYGNTSFLFMGDAENIVENELLSSNANLKADVLKVGHHGSSYSSTASFIKTVSPSHTVISCGTGNQYGHPHAETLATLNRFNINVCRTDESGIIVITSDGVNIKVDKKVSTIKENAPLVDTQTIPNNSNDDTTVFATRTGECYHTGSCSSLSKKQNTYELKRSKIKRTLCLQAL